eukprot:COSAG01_NODE_790_length_13572_cov_4.015587_15_plen_157_part_00
MATSLVGGAVQRMLRGASSPMPRCCVLSLLLLLARSAGPVDGTTQGGRCSLAALIGPLVAGGGGSGGGGGWALGALGAQQRAAQQVDPTALAACAAVDHAASRPIELRAACTVAVCDFTALIGSLLGDGETPPAPKLLENCTAVARAQRDGCKSWR